MGHAGRRAMLEGRLRRAQVLAVAGVAVAAGGLSAAVAGVIPGRAPAHPLQDPFSAPLNAFPPSGTGAHPVTVSGAS